MTISGKRGKTAGLKQALQLFLFRTREIMKYIFMGSLRCCVSVFPINDNKVFFSNFSGKKYADSPKYISEMLHRTYPEMTIVWQQRRGYNLGTPDYVRTVRFKTVRWLYELMTSRVWVDSHLKPLYIRKRKRQFFLNTWHGGLGFKRIEDDVISLFSNPLVESEKRMAYHTAQMVDAFLSNSKWIEDIYRSAFHYTGKILRTGFPRNDLFFRDLTSVREKVRNFFGLEDEFVVLYAPTFRDIPKAEQFSICPEQVIRTVEETLGKGKKVVFMVKFHPLMMEFAERFFSFSDAVIDATDYPDTQEIVASADCVISDYSSIVFDALLLKLPVFLFVPDYERYKAERGFYLELDEYPFSYGKDTETVCVHIRTFDKDAYEQGIRVFAENVQLTETGKATEKAVELIGRELYRQKEEG